jgi:hypothetical protein
MSYKYTSLPYEFREDPKALAAKLMETFMANNSNLQKTWADLNITAFTWYRYVRFLGIKESLVDLRKALNLNRYAPRYPDERPSVRAEPAVSLPSSADEHAA